MGIAPDCVDNGKKEKVVGWTGLSEENPQCSGDSVYYIQLNRKADSLIQMVMEVGYCIERNEGEQGLRDTAGSRSPA